jgi:hypothetical protein
MSSIKLQVANFTGDKGENVGWVAFTEQKMAGLKKAKVKVNGAEKYVAACSPESVLAILDATNHDEMRAVCREAIRLATPRTVAPKPTADVVRYFYLKCGELQLNEQNAPRLLTVEEVVEKAADNSLFCKVGSQQWATAKDLGLVAPPVVVPPLPPAIPVAPPAPPIPDSVSESVPMEPPAPVVPRTNIAASAQDAMQRILAAKRAS